MGKWWLLEAFRLTHKWFPRAELLQLADDEIWSSSIELVSTRLDSVSSEPTTPLANDSFDDLRGKISKKTLDVIKQLHHKYINAAHMQRPPAAKVIESEPIKEEIVHVTGKLEILWLKFNMSSNSSHFMALQILWLEFSTFQSSGYIHSLHQLVKKKNWARLNMWPTFSGRFYHQWPAVLLMVPLFR